VEHALDLCGLCHVLCRTVFVAVVQLFLKIPALAAAPDGARDSSSFEPTRPKSGTRLVDHRFPDVFGF
jgi:hypothetical protein